MPTRRTLLTKIGIGRFSRELRKMREREREVSHFISHTMYLNIKSGPTQFILPQTIHLCTYNERLYLNIDTSSVCKTTFSRERRKMNPPYDEWGQTTKRSSTTTNDVRYARCGRGGLASAENIRRRRWTSASRRNDESTAKERDGGPAARRASLRK